MRTGSNISLTTIRNIICILSRFIKTFDPIRPRSFHDIGNSDISLYLNSFRKSEDEDPTQKWIGTHTYVLSTLSKFYRWLYYPDARPQDRALPECVSGFRKIKRKELARYSPSDLWTMQEHAMFLKYCPSTKIKAYHAMALDTSARPHELLKLKIKDMKEGVIPATNGRAECIFIKLSLWFFKFG